ncbi:uncharacterized protein LOC110976471 [Acanthaster planci]|uniref:Uncharacterized protein LOC110976471 n=1 Tax=Acanthaster planci TaxID=133434 RepID=A0A8B7XZH7_ACAPL|nr:uncharacterized protein LOC110976471 [Acanthaster planci]
MASQDASVTVATKQALQKGHRFGPYKGRLRAADIDDDVPFGAWKIYPKDENDKTYILSSQDPTLPRWLHCIKITKEEAECNITLVQVGFKFYFEMTKDVLEGVEYALRGRRSERPTEDTDEPACQPPPPGKRRGRKPRKEYTPEELQALEERKKKELEERIRRTSTRDRSRRCVECGEKFTSGVLFMRHRGKCGVLKEEDLLTESSDGDENTDDEQEKEPDNEEGKDEENGDSMDVPEEEDGAEGGEGEDEENITQLGEAVDHLIAGMEADEGEDGDPSVLAESGQQDAPVIPNPLLREIGDAPVPLAVTVASPLPVKRPRGRPRKDGRPPIQRKKRGRRKRRKRRRRFDDDDDEDHQPIIKQVKDECLPSQPDPERFPFTCETCQKVFPTKSWFDFHLEQHAQPSLTYLVCNLCDMAFRYLTEHTWHMEEIHQLGRRDQVLSEKFRCDTCKKAFRSPIHLERHRRRAAAEEPLPKGPVQIKCKFCEKSFSIELGLENHTEKFHPEHQRYQCTENDCLVTFATKEGRAEHLETDHMTDSRQIYKCPVDQCYKAYTTMAALNYHYELRHTGASRPFQCEICGKRWVKIGKLREHLKTHSTEKNELCDICGRAYKSRPELKDHRIEAHTEGGKIKLQCRFCPAHFSRRSSRSYHEKRHKNDFPYACPKPGCNKRFIAVIDFKRHLIFHTGAKLYRCRFCGNCFTRSDYLKSHEKKHHLRGEKLIPGPAIEETVTIKVPWPMEKGVKVHGQNVVVIIEPDPALAEGRLTEEAISALESLHEGEGNQAPVQLTTDSSGQHIITSITEVATPSTDILHQAAAEAMQETPEQPIQLLQFQANSQQAIDYVQGNSASAAIQEAVFQAMSSQQQQQQQQQTQAVLDGGAGAGADATHQILLQTGEGEGEETAAAAFLQQALGGQTQILQTANSEQAALMLQQLAANGAQVVFQPASDTISNGTTTMQATLESKNGETSIVMVNLGPDMMTEVNGSTTSTISIPVMTSDHMTPTTDMTTEVDGTASAIPITVTDSEHMTTPIVEGGTPVIETHTMETADAVTHEIVNSDPAQALTMEEVIAEKDVQQEEVAMDTEMQAVTQQLHRGEIITAEEVVEV